MQSGAHFQGEHGSPGLIGKKYGDGYFRGLTTQGVSPHPLGSVLIVLQSCCQTEFEADEDNIAADHLQNIFFFVSPFLTRPKIGLNTVGV